MLTKKWDKEPEGVFFMLLQVNKSCTCNEIHSLSIAKRLFFSVWFENSWLSESLKALFPSKTSLLLHFISTNSSTFGVQPSQLFKIWMKSWQIVPSQKLNDPSTFMKKQNSRHQRLPIMWNNINSFNKVVREAIPSFECELVQMPSWRFHFLIICWLQFSTVSRNAFQPRAHCEIIAQNCSLTATVWVQLKILISCALFVHSLRKDLETIRIWAEKIICKSMKIMWKLSAHL